MNNLMRTVVCSECKEEVEVYWGSFLGNGKKCPKCKNKITFDNMECFYIE